MSIKILNKKHGQSAWNIISDAAQSFEKKKQLRHELWIVTCYIELNLIEKYVEYLIKTIKLTDVFLAFNFSEIYKIGAIETNKKLHSIKEKLNNKNINFEWRVLTSSKLVHGKSYALIQRLNGVTSDGVTLITSANFTNSGFKGDNIELGYLSTKKGDIKDFEKTYNYLWDELGCDIDQAISKQEGFLLKYALLSSGVFLHKWAGTISQQIGIKYKLTPLAKEKGTIAPELAEVGFEAGDSFTRQVLELGELPEKEVPKTFITRFTIETYWGRWCPRDAWITLSESFNGAEKFINKFQEVTEEIALQSIKDNALEIQSNLINKGLVKPVAPEHLDRWSERIQELRSNDRRLERFYTGYDANDLPYIIEQKNEIIQLFDSLEEAIDLSKATNIAKDKITAALYNKTPESINLTDEEKQLIREMSQDA